MGNRAVITTPENYKNNGVGVYLHWNGGRDSVSAFLKYCKMKGYRAPETDCYGWARFCQAVGNFFGGDLSLGVDTVNRLDCNNFDNGVYLVENWEIVGRDCIPEDFVEQHEYALEDMLLDIDKAQPRTEQIGAEAIKNILKGEK